MLKMREEEVRFESVSAAEAARIYVVAEVGHAAHPLGVAGERKTYQAPSF